ncbi:MAG TPA: exostosin family protein [Tepidisphaeraceae bacterium]|nr:exostosin family protein [Tepidisphaeraceae bacterium]
MPRTLFWDRLLSSLTRNPRFTPSENNADILLPAEDVAMEMNWPRYGRLDSAFVRGQLDQQAYDRYMNQLLASLRPLCIVNTYPAIRLPQIARDRANIYVADTCLADFERSLNPRTIAMPVPPITSGHGKITSKSILASFRGVDSHPTRTALAKLHDGKDFICQIVPPNAHIGKLDATASKIDPDYANLMANSIFAIVPRGDSLFSYRLTEALSFGCIPVIISDAWILPFDRLIDWNAISVRLPESQVAKLPDLLRLFSAPRIAEMRKAAHEAFHRHFADTDAMAESLLRSLEIQFPGVFGAFVSGSTCS